LWNVFDEQKVVEAVTIALDKGNNAHEIASSLANSAVTESTPYSDNVTVMVIFFIWGDDNNE